MNVIQFLLQHLDTILTLLSIVAVLVLGLVYITKNGRNFINAMLLSFVTIAEKEFGAGTGALKKSQVVTAVYERLPSIMRLFISEATVSKLIDNAVQEAKAKWKENARLAEIIGGEVTDQKAVETITAELAAIIERITSDEGKAVTMELLKSVAELCGIDTSQFKKKADAVAALQSYIK